MLLFQCADAAAERARIEGLGVRTVWRHDEADCVATHFHPADLPGAIVSIDTMLPLADWHQELADWKWAGPDWRTHVRTDRVQALAGVAIQADDPEAVAARWSTVFGRPLVRRADGTPQLAFDNATLRFVPDSDGRGLGLAALDVLPQDRGAVLSAAAERGLPHGDDHVVLCGMRINLI